jgi:hypothetical protein
MSKFNMMDCIATVVAAELLVASSTRAKEQQSAESRVIRCFVEQSRRFPRVVLSKLHDIIVHF